MQRSRLLVTVRAEHGLRQATGSLIMTLGRNMNEDFHQYSSREDHPLVRLFAYAFGTGVSILVVAGAMFLLQTGVLFRPIAKYNMRNIDESNKRIALWTKIAAYAGAGIGVFYSARYELGIHRRNKNGK